MRYTRWFIWSTWILLSILMTGWPFNAAVAGKIRELRVGMIPSVMQSQALVSMDLSYADHCWYKQRLPGVTVQWIPFNSGEKIIAAIREQKVDLAYIGPGPILDNLGTGNHNVQILSGAVRGGAALVVRESSNLESAADFKGKRVATPSFGSPQDIACRAWLMDAGLKIHISGGDVDITPTANPDQLMLFMNGHVDGVWTQEPWVSRLEQVAGAQIIYETQTALATVLIASKEILQEDRTTIEAFAKAHEDLTFWMKRNPDESQRRMASQLTRLDRRPFPVKLVEKAWPRLILDTHVCLNGFKDILTKARRTGFVKQNLRLEELFIKNSAPD